jgi:hypothetical protein
MNVSSRGDIHAPAASVHRWCHRSEGARDRVIASDSTTSLPHSIDRSRAAQTRRAYVFRRSPLRSRTMQFRRVDAWDIESQGSG